MINLKTQLKYLLPCLYAVPYIVISVQSSECGFSSRFHHLSSSEITVVHSKELEIIILVNCQFHVAYPNAFLIAFEF